MSYSVKIGTRLGKFEILGRLGSGGAGAVYRAKNLEDGREVALKTLMPNTADIEEVYKRFVREITVAQKLRHENIVAYDDCALHEDVLFYTMELVPWGSLGDVLARRRTIGWQEAAECGIHICQGLDHLHSNNVVHRDLKPANIFLSDDGRLKVGDFGLARDHDSERLTIDGQTVGTAKYLAPEQAMAKPDIDGRADLYSLGCILFEMMAGRTPFTSDEPHGAVNYVQLMRKHVEMQPPSLTDFVVGCPPALAAFISRLLAKNPDDRPKSAAEVSTILAEIIRDPSVEPCKVGRQAELEVPELRSLTERLHETTESSRQVNAKAMIAIATITFIGLAIFWVFKQNK